MMTKKLVLLVFILFFGLFIFSQNKKILLGLHEVPQSLMLNPGADVKFKWHVGVPLLSDFYLHGGASGFAVNDVFSVGGDINLKLINLFDKLDNKDFYTVNQQLEIFNVGYRLKNRKDYLNFGFYEEFDGILAHPKDLITLVYEGNEDLSREFHAEDINVKAELLGVFHVGLSKKINRRLTVGGRFKIYSSVFNVNSTNNSGVFFTTQDPNQENIYSHHFQGVDFSLETSGLINRDGESILSDENNEFISDNFFSKFLASDNMGMGVDVGLTYKPREQIKITASVLDFGYVRHKKEVVKYEVDGSFTFDGLDLIFPTTGPVIDYWQNFEDDVDINLPLDTIANQKYTSYRSTKVNTALIYRFGKRHNDDCLRTIIKDAFKNEAGLQLYTIFRPRKPQVAATLFYYRRFSKYLSTKVTYTIDDYGAKNIGFGLTSRFGMFNLYTTVDNLLGYVDLAKSNNQSFQLGLNFILDYDENKLYKVKLF